MREACVLLLMFGCTTPLPNAQEVLDNRVLAIVIEPPEVSPGQSVTVQAYFSEPTRARIGQCDDRFVIDCADTIMAEGDAQPFAPGLFRFDASVTTRSIGWEFVFVHGASIDAAKRIVVSDTSPKNNNPVLKEIVVLTMAGQQVMPPITLTAGTAYRLLAVYTPEITVEPYKRTLKDGRVEDAIEEMSMMWSCGGGCAFDRELTYEFDSIKFTPKAETTFVYVAMRDTRGGEAVIALPVTVTP